MLKSDDTGMIQDCKHYNPDRTCGIRSYHRGAHHSFKSISGPRSPIRDTLGLSMSRSIEPTLRVTPPYLRSFPCGQVRSVNRWNGGPSKRAPVPVDVTCARAEVNLRALGHP